MFLVRRVGLDERDVDDRAATFVAPSAKGVLIDVSLS